LTASPPSDVSLYLELRIALTQIRLDCEGQKYYRKRREMGDPPLKAIRCLKRRLARVVYQRLRADEQRLGQPAGAQVA
jgi:transposase